MICVMFEAKCVYSEKLPFIFQRRPLACHTINIFPLKTPLLHLVTTSFSSKVSLFSSFIFSSISYLIFCTMVQTGHRPGVNNGSGLSRPTAPEQRKYLQKAAHKLTSSKAHKLTSKYFFKVPDSDILVASRAIV